jgi:hypothetical protein
VVSSALTVPGFEKPGRFIDTAAFIRQHGRPGDRVIVPNSRHAWAFNWYFFGPGWDRSLVMSPAVTWRPAAWRQVVAEIRRYDNETRPGAVDIISDAGPVTAEPAGHRPPRPGERRLQRSGIDRLRTPAATVTPPSDSLFVEVVPVDPELLRIRKLSLLSHRRIYRPPLGQERFLLASLRILRQ